MCTDGGRGSRQREITSEELVKIRAAEQREACYVLGVKELVMLGYSDGELEDTKEFRREIVRAIRRFRPDVVLTSNPFLNNNFTHRDHRMVGQVTMDAMFPYARDHLHYPELLKEGLEPFKAGAILLWGNDQPDTFIDITETIELKIKALLCHKSQVSAEVGERIKDWAGGYGKRLGVQYAEAFRKIEFRR
jgi:LmbE family N-acetylglucosaminyl deacetylase